MSKNINRRELAKHISEATGFTMKDILEVLSAEDNIIAELISQGYNIKRHKLWKLNLDTKKEKRAYNGLEKEYYIIPEKKILKFKALSQLTQAVENYNNKDIEEEED